MRNVTGNLIANTVNKGSFGVINENSSTVCIGKSALLSVFHCKCSHLQWNTDSKALSLSVLTILFGQFWLKKVNF